MPNQNECDHVVGIYWLSASAVVIAHLSENLKVISPLRYIKTNNFCPNCGAKIDWKKIKEACDENNN
jgi:hypothetical protein